MSQENVLILRILPSSTVSVMTNLKKNFNKILGQTSNKDSDLTCLLDSLKDGA